MSPSRSTRRKGVRRRPPRKTPARSGPAGSLARIGRYLLGGLLLVVILLFVASACGWLTLDPQPRVREPAMQTLVSWDSPAATTPGEDRGLAARVFAWAEDALSGEPLVSQVSCPEEPAQVPAAGASVSAEPPVRVYLTNGCGVDRLAASLREPLRGAGFDVCGVDDADRSDYSETLIVDRCGRPAAANAVCAYFRRQWGVGRVLRQVRDSAVTDVLVILGRDLGDLLRPPVAAEQASE